MLANKLMSTLSGGAGDKLYVDDVFSTYIYTGNGTTQTINNGIDLAGKGGLVWNMLRNATGGNHILVDTARGGSASLFSNTTDAQIPYGGVSSFNPSGYTITETYGNNAGFSFVSWTFRKAPKFFDVVTYTGDGASTKAIAHNLGTSPGCIIIKRTDAASAWYVYHHELGVSPVGGGGGTGLQLNTTGAAENYSAPVTAVSLADFTVFLNGATNSSGANYVAYLFAHDTSADGIVQCGSFTPDASGNATVNLGWEPQYLLMKRADDTSSWFIIDTARGWTNGTAWNTPDDAYLVTNTNAPELRGGGLGYPTATGFVTQMNPGSTSIYLAIRRPNKPPTTGTDVYNAIARTGTGAAATVTGVGFAPDLVLNKSRSTTYGNWTVSRLTGYKTLVTEGATAENNYTTIWPTDCFTLMDGVKQGGGSDGVNVTGITYINHFFKRAPGFFDVVCYTGNGAGSFNVNHSLGVKPEMFIVKRRNGAGGWSVTWSVGSVTFAFNQADGRGLNSAAEAGGPYGVDNTLTTTTFNPVNFFGGPANTRGGTYVAYLFASLPGISKVGSYIGNGTIQTINCGFTTGARFILIKRSNSTGDWYVWDTARGIVSANDPHLSLNTTAAEVTSDDSVDPHASGFIVNQVAATNINVSGGQYIFLAIA